MLLQLFDTHTPFTLSVLYLLYRFFEHCALHQPAVCCSFSSEACFLRVFIFRRQPRAMLCANRRVRVQCLMVCRLRVLLRRTAFPGLPIGSAARGAQCQRPQRSVDRRNRSP